MNHKQVQVFFQNARERNIVHSDFSLPVFKTYICQNVLNNPCEQQLPKDVVQISDMFFLYIPQSLIRHSRSWKEPHRRSQRCNLPTFTTAPCVLLTRCSETGILVYDFPRTLLSVLNLVSLHTASDCRLEYRQPEEFVICRLSSTDPFTCWTLKNECILDICENI